MHEEQFWASFSEGAEIWKLVVVVAVISLLGFIGLRIATRVMADRRTRKILIEGMKPEDGESAGGGSTDGGRDPGSKVGKDEMAPKDPKEGQDE